MRDLVVLRVASDELRDTMGLECISVVIRRSRLRWFGHVERGWRMVAGWMWWWLMVVVKGEAGMVVIRPQLAQ